jgi:uncharacterized protein YecT (DUF1311 family)
MQNHDDRSCALLPKGVFLVALFAAITPASHATSFDCQKASPPVETAICGNSELSKLDSDLAVTWKNALARSKNTSALKTAQRRWLTERNACGADTACLTDRYRERLAALNGSSLPADRWDQTRWLNTDIAGVGGQLTFTGSPPNLHFSMQGVNGANASGYDGDVTLTGEEAHYRGKDGCQLDFSRKATRIFVREKSNGGKCGEASGVGLGGEYVTWAKFAAKPQADLVTLKVLDDAAQNKAAHSLLGKDYETVVDTVNMNDPQQDLDGLGANVQHFFVRGLADTNASIVMHHGTQLWVGVLVFDSGNHVRMRYYTNVPEWKQRLPKTLRAWHDSIDKNIPIDMMS